MKKNKIFLPGLRVLLAVGILLIGISIHAQDIQWSNNYANGGMDNNVWSIAADGDNVYVGGDFHTAGGTASQLIGKWNKATNLWADYGNFNNEGFFVDEILVANNNVYTGGFFFYGENYVKNSKAGISQWIGGTDWTPLGTGIDWWSSDPYVYAMAKAPSGNDIYVGGAFTVAGETAANNIARWDGTNWHTLGSGNNNGVNNYFVNSIAVHANGDVYAGGNFTQAGGNAANHIAKWNGTSWSTLSSGLNNTVKAIAIHGDDVYIGGFFTDADGDANGNDNYIVKWNTLTNAWSPLGTGMNGAVQAIAVAANGDVYAGGDFTMAGSVSASHIAKWNGTDWEALGSGTNDTVLALAISGNDLFVGGEFTMAGGNENNYFAKYSIPAISFAVSSNCVNTLASFTNTSTGLPSGATYLWDFGDGDTSTFASPTHVYNTVGTYTVKLTVNETGQFFGSSTRIIHVDPCIECPDCIGSFAPIPGEQYVLGAWVQQTSGVTANTYSAPTISLAFTGGNPLGPFTATGPIIDGWQRIDAVFTIPVGASEIFVQLNNSSSVSGVDVYFDDIRIHPLKASLKSFVYDPVSLRLMAEMDENNYATFYEYDEEGALIRVKKETERGIKTIKETGNNTRKK